MTIFLQAVLATAVSVNQGSVDISVGPLIFYFLVVLLLLAIIFLLIRKFIGLKKSLTASFDKKIFLISLPKYQSLKSAHDENEDRWKELISHAESLFATLGGLKADSTMKRLLKGKSDYISFEIVAYQGLIYFYLAVPTRWQRFIIQQIHAQYPAAQIEECGDYNIFKPNSVVFGSYLVFANRHSLPLKTYRTMDSDPLNSITNALSKLNEDEGAALQILASSAPASWRHLGRQIVARLQKGESPERVKQRRNFISYIFDTVFKNWTDNKDKNKLEERPELSPLEQKMIESVEEKMSKAGLDVNIRIVVSTDNESTARNYLNDIANSFSQFNIYEYGNKFKTVHFRPNHKVVSDFIFRNFNHSMKMVMNTEELASLYHFPHSQIDTRNISWLAANQATPPVNLPRQGVIAGTSEYRGEKVDVRIKTDDRRRHIYIIGQTGTGKSTLIKNIAIQDINNNDGCCLIDPHGDLAVDILKNIPRERAEDVIYFNPADSERPLALNMLEFETSEQKSFVVNEMLSIFDKLYDLKATGGPMFEQYMRNAILLVMSDPDSGMTLLEIPRVLSDEKFRQYKLSKCTNPTVIEFWQKEALQAGGEAALANMVPYITSKLTPFISNDLLRPIIAQPKTSINFRKIMDDKQILIVNLSKGKLGDLNSQLLGMVITGKILMAALSRTDLPEDKRSDFYLYIDEFQNFTTDSIAIILSEARKYRLNLTIAHQYIGQLVKHNDSTIKDAVFGNVGTTLAFRVGVEDAETIAKQLAPVFNEYDVVNIPKFSAYAKILIDNSNPPAFNISIKNSPPGDNQMMENIISLSRLTYGRPRGEIEQEISRRHLVQKY